MKRSLSIFCLGLALQTVPGLSQDFSDISHPLNPMNPISPLNPINMSRSDDSPRTPSKSYEEVRLEMQQQHNIDVSRADEIGKRLGELRKNQDNAHQLLESDCYAKAIASLGDYVTAGYRVTRVRLSYESAGYKNWQGSYQRLVGKLLLELTPATNDAPALNSTNDCRTSYWRW